MSRQQVKRRPQPWALAENKNPVPRFFVSLLRVERHHATAELQAAKVRQGVHNDVLKTNIVPMYRPNLFE